MSPALNHTVSFEKFHGTGNDFVVVDADDSVPYRGRFAETHCDRETGVADESGAHDRRGADGVLFLALEHRFHPPRIVMTLVQPDGSVAAMCGNGARCAAAWAAARTDATEFMIDTQAGTKRAVVRGNAGGDDPLDITVEMGVPTFDPRDVPLAADHDGELVAEELDGLELTAVNTGVPHAVAFVDDVDDIALDAVAPAIRHADVFSEGANVTLASRDDDGGFSQRTFERGVEGETQSCGTGAVAIVAAAKRLGHVEGDDPVRVSPPGGDLEITVPDRGSATLRGPVEAEYEGRLAAMPEQ
ncbi:diaminopimelate epimerase [Haloprofundus marisrubri]|uniref:Diaminopimelate epimerase n=1 Tax=Haloprofundus marisrubri TaxID=1514971 RepID=A0A0W1R975_9EURY|nr:diaminopimelate epimerase [Haloprofundus marisrubri]KTG09895.1 diaminopimelate epimerase [Haloprofundus marisrubri]